MIINAKIKTIKRQKPKNSSWHRKNRNSSNNRQLAVKNKSKQHVAKTVFS